MRSDWLVGTLLVAFEEVMAGSWLACEHGAASLSSYMGVETMLIGLAETLISWLWITLSVMGTRTQRWNSRKKQA